MSQKKINPRRLPENLDTSANPGDARWFQNLSRNFDGPVVVHGRSDNGWLLSVAGTSALVRVNVNDVENEVHVVNHDNRPSTAKAQSTARQVAQAIHKGGLIGVSGIVMLTAVAIPVPKSAEAVFRAAGLRVISSQGHSHLVAVGTTRVRVTLAPVSMSDAWQAAVIGTKAYAFENKHLEQAKDALRNVHGVEIRPRVTPPKLENHRIGRFASRAA